MTHLSSDNPAVFTLSLSDVRPSQVYVSQEKLNSVTYALRCGGACLLAPVPVVKIRNQWVLTDGHTRCLGLLLHDYTEVQVYQDNEAIDLLMYLQCLKWCKEDGVMKIADLKDRVIPHAVFEKFWLRRCRVMNQLLHYHSGSCRSLLENQKSSENSSSPNSSEKPSSSNSSPPKSSPPKSS